MAFDGFVIRRVEFVTESERGTLMGSPFLWLRKASSYGYEKQELLSLLSL
jgi:hypothetical protein